MKLDNSWLSINGQTINDLNKLPDIVNVDTDNNFDKLDEELELEDELLQYVKTNREKSRTSKRIKFFCLNCDASLVSQSERCPVCGFRQNRKKLNNY